MADPQKPPEVKPKPLRNEKGHLLPGQTANPGGRPKGLERRVRELVDFDAITVAMADIAMGRTPEGVQTDGPIKTRDRIAAASLLYDRGFGKARAIVDLAAEINQGGMQDIDVDVLDDAAFAALERAVTLAISGIDPGKIIDVGGG